MCSLGIEPGGENTIGKTKYKVWGFWLNEKRCGSYRKHSKKQNFDDAQEVWKLLAKWESPKKNVKSINIYVCVCVCVTRCVSVYVYYVYTITSHGIQLSYFVPLPAQLAWTPFPFRSTQCTMRCLGRPATWPETAIIATHPVVGAVVEQCFLRNHHYCWFRVPKMRPMIPRLLRLYDNEDNIANLIL